MIVGYDDEGRIALMRDYAGGDEVARRATAELQMFALFLDAHEDALPPRDAALQGIALGVRNWDRRHDPAENEERGYWHGRMAFERWSEDIGRYDTLTEEERSKLFFVSWWNFDGLADARRHAGLFLRQVAPLFRQAARPTLERAAALYDREADLLGRSFYHKDVFLGPWTGKGLNDWTQEVRRREQEMLAEASRIEAEAIDCLRELVSIEQAS